MSQERYCACPYCEAVFRLPDSKFKRKEGIVRCGACRSVFDSNHNLVQRSGSGFVAVSGNMSRPIKSGSSNSQPAMAPGEAKETTTHSRPGNSMGAAGQAPKIDESLAVTQYPEQDLEFSAPAYPWDGDIKSDSFNEESIRDILIDDVKNPFAEKTPVKSAREVSVSDEDRKEPVLGPLNLNEAPGNLSDVASRESESEFVKSQPDKSLLPDSENYSEHFDSELNLNLVTSGVSPDNLSSESVNTIDDDSELEINNLSKMRGNGVNELISDRKNPFITFVWFVVAAAFIALLGLQVKHFFVEKYAQYEEYRPYLSAFCKVADCELPPRQDPYKFTLTHTKIDLHPTQPGAIRVTVKLVNEADYSQPYPFLQLTLTDKVGRVVGRRTFTPDLYLEKSKQNLLGKGELASILFDLARPHEKAVGFVVDIVTDTYST
jgi:predicted Zn finger-like uncharacterized protein